MDNDGNGINDLDFQGHLIYVSHILIHKANMSGYHAT